MWLTDYTVTRYIAGLECYDIGISPRTPWICAQIPRSMLFERRARNNAIVYKYCCRNCQNEMEVSLRLPYSFLHTDCPLMTLFLPRDTDVLAELNPEGFFIIKGFRTIVFIFIVISTTFQEPSGNFELHPLLNPRGSPVLIPLAITG